MPKLAPLMRDYPEVNVEIVIDYGLTNIVAEGIDAACEAASR